MLLLLWTHISLTKRTGRHSTNGTLSNLFNSLYEWRKFEDRIVKDPSDLYKEKAIRKDRLKDVFKISDEEAETKLSDINKKIETYNGAVYKYLSSSDMKKNNERIKN